MTRTEDSAIQQETFIRYEGAAIEQTIANRFEQQAEQFPTQIAVQTKVAALSYDALNSWADRVANSILDHCAAGNLPVAVLTDMTASTIAAMLGVWKAGHIYAPVDRASMPAKGDAVIEATRPQVVLANSESLEIGERLAGKTVPVLNVDALTPRGSPSPSHSPGNTDDPAILLYTSGSTGKPKGIVQNHRNPLHHVMLTTNACQISSLDRMSLVRPPSFVGGVMNTLCALMNGATLVAFDVREDDIATMADWLRRERISFFHLGPNLYRHFLATLKDSQDFPDLRLIRLSGEPLTRKDIEEYKRRFAPNCVLMNALSSTEAITFRQFFVHKNTIVNTEHVPAGYPVPDLEVSLVGEDGSRVAAGEVGEIVIKSRYLFPGYWQDPESTRMALVPVRDGSDERVYHTGDLGRMDAGGCMEHLGRKDFRVKIRGYSVDTAEVEAALLNISGVKQAVVATRDNFDGQKRLVAFIVADQGVVLDMTEVRQNVAQRLPSYCVPPEFVALDALPITSSGKIDRAALPAPDRSRRVLDRPLALSTNPVEEALVKTWSNALGVEQLGIHDPFLEIGGDSLVASKLVSELNEVYGRNLPVNVIFEATSVAELARVLISREPVPGQTEKIARAFLEIEQMSDDEVRTALERERRQRGNAG